MNINNSEIKGSEIRRKRYEVVVISPLKYLGIEEVDIPEWLLIELLSRLDVKLIFRLKLVCKQWLSVISDPSFARLYVSRASSLQPSQPWAIVSRVMFLDRSKRLEFLEYESVENVYSPKLKSPSYILLHLPSTQHPHRGKIEIYAISNGLVLCTPIVPNSDATYNRAAIYNICNPVTGQRIVLPPLTCNFNNVHKGFVTQVEDGMLKSYRVVCLDWPLLRTDMLIFHVFISESGEWRDFNVRSSLRIGMSPVTPTDLHGNLHWVFHDKILAYDPYGKPNALRIIPLPHYENDEHNMPREERITRVCGVSDGKLRYLELSGLRGIPQGFSSFNVWILDDYSSGDWSLQNRITSFDIHCDAVLWCLNKFMVRMAFDPYDSDIVHIGCVNVVVSYNIKTKSLETPDQPLISRQLEDRSEQILALDSYISYYDMPLRSGLMFVIPPWPTSISLPSSGCTEK